MFISPKFVIAVKCSSCGKFKKIDIDLFKAKEAKGLKCECGGSLLSYKIVNKEVVLDIKCVFCDRIHRYKFKLKDIIEKPLKIINCSFNGFEIAFAGKDDAINAIIDRYENDFDELLKILGFNYQSSVRRV
jgi:uncharacterized protein YlaI